MFYNVLSKRTDEQRIAHCIAEGTFSDRCFDYELI